MSAAWFVDGAYAMKAWNRVAGHDERMDYSCLRDLIEADAKEKIEEAYYFNCDSDPPNSNQNSFHRFLQSPPPRGVGMRVKLYWLQSYPLMWPAVMGGNPVIHPQTGEHFIQKTQKGVDVGLAFHMMRSFSKRGWEKLYLIAGDGDFHEIVEHLVEDEDVDLTLIGNSDSMSGQLCQYARRIVEFGDIRQRIARPAHA